MFRKSLAHCTVVLAVLSAVLIQAAAAESSRALRQKQNFDFGWRFQRGDVAGAELRTLDDSQWRLLDLPHDWSIEPDTNIASLPPGVKPSGTPTPPPSARTRKKSQASEDLLDLKLKEGVAREGIFDPASPAEHGGAYLTAGVAWYRKTFALSPELRQKRVFIEFDGVYMNSDVWINGKHLGFHPYGYTSFQYELTPDLLQEESNVLAVRVNVEQPSSRWYSGSGIYRHVWLTTTDPVHVSYCGTAVTTPEIKADSALIRVRTSVSNQDGAKSSVVLRSIVLDPKGKEVGAIETSGEVAAGSEEEFAQEIRINDPQLWSMERPVLYTVTAEISANGKPSDRYITPFGIRSFEFTLEGGFLLNGKRVALKGVCLHHDQGYLGAAAYDRAIERQLEIMKSMGVNAVRTSHNPPAPALLDLCDRMGLVVMDEAFDEWLIGKRGYGYARYFEDWHERDLVAMIHRDRNHPSIVLWSVGNEIPDMTQPEGVRITKGLVDICHREDPSRPVTAACNNPPAMLKSGNMAALDVVGVNYALAFYDTVHGQFPAYSSESSSDVSSRGDYNLVLKDGAPVIEAQLDNQVSSYDVYAPGWAFTAEVQLLKLKESPWISGEFVWTGFDYLGEPTPFKWPSVSSYFGIVDLCGFPKDRYYLYQSEWIDKPRVHILPHWSWPGWEGKPIPVWCYANADSVELFLNGKSLGKRRCFDPLSPDMLANARQAQLKATNGLHVEWKVPYQPGVLKALARRGNRVVAQDEIRTSGKPARLELEVDRPTIQATGQDLAYITARVLDKDGNLCPTADNLIRFSVQGSATLAAVGNGNAASHEDFIADHRKAYNGMCLVILKSTRASGAARITAESPGLISRSLQLKAR